MTDVRPFRGLRFNHHLVSQLADVLCPPFDVISPQEQRLLYERSPFNAVRLELGETSPSDSPSDNRYTRAAATLSDWLSRGVLLQEPSPAFYLYEQDFEHEGHPLTRRALFARVRLHQWSEGKVLPHERTLGGPKEDRLRLLRAARVNVSPILALHRDSARLREVFGALERPTIETEDAAGQRHHLHVRQDASAIGLITEAFRDASVYVIDGHHRYETALAYREERREQSSRWSGDEPENFVLMAVVALDDPGLVVLPSHRLLRTPPPPRFLDRLAETFRLRDVGDWDEMRAALAKTDREEISFGVATAERRVIAVIDTNSAARLMPSETPRLWRSLDAAVLRELVLKRLLGIDEERAASEQSVEFTHNGAEALRLVESGGYGLAFLLSAVPPEKVIEIADAGERMPQKTTYFYPKIPAGLVLNPLF
ncbi:MAG: DUF1015 domain-containing protein [Dehalococcoidia bacterium]|nr:DUF1015 domain-containing protein [Dehalococcoidia bacterium]